MHDKHICLKSGSCFYDILCGIKCGAYLVDLFFSLDNEPDLVGIKLFGTLSRGLSPP